MTWYVLNHIARTPGSAGSHRTATEAVETCNRLNGTQLDIFAPTIVKVIVRDGRHIISDKPLTYHYVFVRGPLDHVKTLCAGSNGFSFVINAADPDNRYATVTDADMHAFRTIALAYNNQLPFLDLAHVDLEAGDLVEIVEGDFPGLTGYYMPHPKSTAGDIILRAAGGLGTIVYNIRARYVRILQFSPHSRRAYDQIDAFVPRLYAALRAYHAGETPARREITALTVFTRRMGQLDTHNPKLQAKLTALLWASYTILGQPHEARQQETLLTRLEPHITAAATRSLLTLLRAIIERRLTLLTDGLAHLLPADPQSPTSTLTATTPSRADSALLAEYHYYLSTAATNKDKNS